MSTYRYKAVDREGKTVKGTVEAVSEFDAVDQIRQTCPIISEVKEVAEKSRKGVSLTEPLWVTDKVLSLTASQFAILLRSGLPMSRTVEVVAQQSADKLMRRILTDVSKDVEAGYSLAQSLDLHGQKIPMTFIETVRAGEESGTLETAFQRLEVYYARTDKIRSKVRSAMNYPIFLMLLAAVVITIIMKFSIPVIGGMILDSGGELPAPTVIMMGIYDFFAQWWPLVLGVALLLVVGFLLFRKQEKGKLVLGHLTTKLPIVGNITRLKAASQFAGTLATMLAAGMSVSRALDITGKVMDNHAIGATVRDCTAGIEEGKLLGEVLDPNPYLPRLLVEMTSVGEESGALEETLNTIGTYFDAETERASAKALAMMEPAMTVVLGVVIGFIVIALYMPMFTMYNSI